MSHLQAATICVSVQIRNSELDSTKFLIVWVSNIKFESINNTELSGFSVGEHSEDNGIFIEANCFWIRSTDLSPHKTVQLSETILADWDIIESRTKKINRHAV